MKVTPEQHAAAQRVYLRPDPDPADLATMAEFTRANMVGYLMPADPKRAAFWVLSWWAESRAQPRFKRFKDLFKRR